MSLRVLFVVEHMHDVVVEVALGCAGVEEVCDGAVPSDVAGISAGAGGAHVGELCGCVGARGLGEADGCGAQQAATACDGAR